MFGSTHRSGKTLAVATGVAMFFALTAWCALTVSPSFALKAGGATDFSAGGSTAIVHPGNNSATAVRATSTGPTGEGHVNIAIPRGLKLGQLNSLATDYRFVDGTCANGSPRFTANITDGTTNTSVFFYLAPPPSYPGCASSEYKNTGNLADPSGLVDVGTLPGGSLNDSVAGAKAKYGHFTVTAIHLDVDGGEGGQQVVEFDNTLVNGEFVTYEAEHGISVLLERSSGNIKVKEKGEPGFKKIEKIERIRVNSVVNTLGGRVDVTAATGSFANTTPDNVMTFYDGVIRLQQKRGRNARAIAKLAGKLNCPTDADSAAASASSGGPVAQASGKKKKRRVWGSGSGSYGTAGQGGTGSVVGTTWFTRDTCRGTFFKVTDGIGIRVHDRDLGKRVKLGPGQTYFARIR